MAREPANTPKGSIALVADSLRLPELLGTLFRTGRTGVLEIESGQLALRVAFHQGIPVVARGGSHDTLFGRILLSLGAIDSVEYAVLTERRALASSRRWRFGELAQACGYIDGEGINRALAEQVKRRILASFQWPAPALRFVPSREDAAPVDGSRHPQAVEVLVLAGIRSSFDSAHISERLRAVAGRYPVRLEAAERIGARLELTSEETAFVKDLGGTRTLEDRLLEAPLARGKAAQLIIALEVLGLLRFDEWPKTDAHRPG